jgi:hypothetical protein
MAGFRPIGSEKLQGMDKIRRIMEIARYNENIPQNVNETQSSEYKIGLADGNTYEIVKERQGYIVKKTLNESETEYIEPMKQRKYYSSYSQALKRLNLMTKEINTLFENEEGTPLLGEQKKKFILKSKKPKTEEPAAAATPEPAPAPAPAPEPAPVPEPAPMPDMGETPAPDMGGVPIEEPPMPDMGGAPIEEPPMPDMGGEEEMPPMPEMGSEEEEVDIDVEKKPKEKKVSDLKRIQILTGKLAQKIRSYEEEKELDPKDIKYIINSILSAIDVDVLDEDDIEQIINKLEGVEDEEGGSEEEEVSFEEKSDEEEVAPEPPQEPEMAEGYNDFSTALKDYMGGALASGMSKKLRHEEEDFDMDDEYHRERRKGRKHYPNVDRFEHGTFSESTVDKVLSKYFINEETEINRYEESKTKKTNLNYNQNKQNVIRLSESSNQLDVALEYIKENPRTKLMGLSTRGNLIFKEGINETKITKSGEII